jgi:hypothetical protein
MAVYGDLFSYSLPSIVFDSLTASFIAAYAVAAIWLIARSKGRTTTASRAA